MDPNWVWLANLSRHNDPKRAPRGPIKVPFRNGQSNFSMLGTDRYCMVLTPLSRKPDFELSPAQDRPWAVFTELTDPNRLLQIGQIDALLLKEMAGEPDWTPAGVKYVCGKEIEVSSIALGGAFFNTLLVARALAEWPYPTAMMYRLRDDQMDDLCKITEDKFIDPTKTTMASISPVLLSSPTHIVIMCPIYHKEADAQTIVFPESAIV